MAYQSFEDLEVWQRGCRLSVAIYNAFESCRRFSLKDQIERAGLSIPSDIAEGAERGSAKDFAHFLNFSKGSCAELRTQLYIARKLNSVRKSSFDALVSGVSRNLGHAAGLARFRPEQTSSERKARQTTPA